MVQEPVTERSERGMKLHRASRRGALSVVALPIPLGVATTSAAQSKGNDRITAVKHLDNFQIIESPIHPSRWGTKTFPAIF